MVIEPESKNRLAFGPFEVDFAADELKRGNVKVRLSGQPLQILRILLAHPGEVVTREQLRETIWKDGTFVDFEHGLNAAMNKLRRALGDSADNPRYVETISGRGYRFIGVLAQNPAENAVVGSGRDSGGGEREAGGSPQTKSKAVVVAGGRGCGDNGFCIGMEGPQRTGAVEWVDTYAADVGSGTFEQSGDLARWRDGGLLLRPQQGGST